MPVVRSRSPRILLAVFTLTLFLVSVMPVLASGPILRTRYWAVPGPGGDYGLVEWAGRGPRRTCVRFGPFGFMVPASAPVVACGLAVIAGGLVAAGVAFRRKPK